MPISEAIAAADENEAIARAKAPQLRNAPPGIREEAEEACLIPRLRTATIQRHLSNPHTIFEWSVISGERPENPFARARPISMELAAWRGRSRPGTVALGRCFARPSAVADIPQAAERSGSNSLFWVPLLGLFARLRMKEALHLKGLDFAREDGISYLSVRQGANQSVKSKAGRRRVLIHPALIELCLLRLAQERKSGRLFPSIARSKQRSSLWRPSPNRSNAT